MALGFNLKIRKNVLLIKINSLHKNDLIQTVRKIVIISFNLATRASLVRYFYKLKLSVLFQEILCQNLKNKKNNNIFSLCLYD